MLSFKRNMILKVVLPILFAIGLSACSSNPVIQDYSSQTTFSNYQTYQWLPEGPSTRIQTIQPFEAKRIEQAIINSLHKKGALIVRDQPQAYISYNYQIHRTETLEPSTSVGVGFGSRHFGFGGMFPVDYETRIYEDAIWTINIYDNEKHLIWQGRTSRPLETFASPQESEAYTQQVIDAILDQFPPK